MKHQLFIILLIFICKSTNAQHFEKLANGLTVKTFYHQQGINFYLNQVNQKGEVFNVYYDTVTSSFNYGKEFIQIRMQILNGTSWQFSNSIKLYNTKDINAPRILDIEALGNDIYISGSFDSSENNLGGGILKFSNGTWNSINQTLIKKFEEPLIVNKIIAFNTQLFVIGNFDSIPNNTANGMLVFNGSNWQPIGIGKNAGFNSISSKNNTFFEVSNDSLIAYSYNTSALDTFKIGGYKYTKMAVLNGTQFRQVNNVKGRVLAPVAYLNFKGYIAQSALNYANGLWIQQGTQFKYFALPDSFYATTYLGAINANNKLYFLVQNSNKLVVDIYCFNGLKVVKTSAWKFSNSFISLDFSKYNDKAILSGNFSTISNAGFSDEFVKISRLSFEPTCIIAGTTFLDLNNDKIKQSNEPNLPSTIVYDKNLKVTSLANGTGRFITYLPLNKTLRLEAANTLGYACNEKLNISNTTDTIMVFDFPFQESQSNDAQISILSNTGNKILIGNETVYNLNILNTSADNKVLNLKVNHSPKIKQIVSDNFTPVRNKNYFTFTISLAPHTALTYNYRITYNTDSFVLNENLKMTAQILNSDIELSNNLDSVIQTTTNQLAAYYKVASPSTIQANSNWLNYTIHYKNEGATTAIKTTILDTLDNLLDVARIQFHNNPTSFNNNVIQWDIMSELPPGGAGSVGFSIKVFPTAQEGDSILNKATVILTYQKPKVTNKVKVVFVKNTSIDNIKLSQYFTFYPNPASTYFDYKNLKQIQGALQLIDMSGKVILETTLKDDGRIQLPETLSKGVYTIYIPQLSSGVGKVIVN